MEKISTNEVARKIRAQQTLIFLGGQFCVYKGGRYVPVSKDEIHHLIKVAVNGSFSSALRNEIRACLEADAFIRHDNLNIPSKLINLTNGLLDLESFELQPHDPKFHFMAQIESSYIAGSECPKWIGFLKEALGDDLKKIDLVQEFFGYCLNPVTNMEKSLMLLGEGANGKSVVLNVLRGLLGDANCSSIQMENFDNRNYRAEFFEKMVNISTETNTKAHVYEAIFKELVSGETITADRKYEQPFSFKNTCKLAFAFNEMPRVDDKSKAFYRRILMVPFNTYVPEEKQDRLLSTKLLEEKAGILLWSMEGLKRLRTQGVFTQPESVKNALEAYKRENNNIINFVEECCLFSEADRTDKSVLYLAYSRFCKENGYQAQNKLNFGKNLLRTFHQVKDDRISSKRFWKGITFKSSSDENESMV